MTDNQPTEGPQVRLDKDGQGPQSAGPYVGHSAPFDEMGSQPSGYGAGPTPRPAAALADAGTRKLVAALLAMFLGTLGLHKFYLGYTGAGLVLLLVNLGGWFVTFLLSVITLGVASLFLIPLMTLVSSVMAVCTIIEGVVYLTKTDNDFYQTYLVGRREWF